MKIEDLVMLSRAGFTKDEIMSFLTPDPEPAAQPDPQPDPQPAQATQPDDDRLSKLETKIDYVINRFNYMAVKNSEQPAQQGETVDDILAKMIR